MLINFKRLKALSCFSFASTALATTVSGAQLSGYVTDATEGNALEGAVVSIPSLGLQATTNRSGYYLFRNLAEGEYGLSVNYIGAERFETTIVVDETDERLGIPLSFNVYELEEFEVSSNESASLRALNIKRASVNLTDVVASDFFGQFADSNAAEALNRVSGISIERDQGEGRFVVIRGINPNLNSVALDGVALAAPSADERSTLLDTIPIEVLDTLEVSKAVLPDQPGDSIGGYINLRSPSAFNYNRRTATLSGSLLYSDLVDETGYKVYGTYGDTFGQDDNWGLFVTVINSERTFGSDNVESDAWTIEDEVSADFYIPDDTFEYREYDLTRERTGISANLEYKPSDESLLFLRASYNNYKDTEIRDLAAIEFTPLEEDDDGNVVEVFFSDLKSDSFTNAEMATVIELKEREENMRLFVVSAGGEQTFGDWTIEYTVAYSEAEEDTPFDQEVIYEGNDTSEGSVAGAHTYTPMLGAATGGMDFSDAANFEFDELTVGQQIVEETDVSGKIDFTWKPGQGAFAALQFGALGRTKEKTSDFDEEELDGDAGLETADLFEQTKRRNPFHRPIPSLHTDIFDFALETLETEESENASLAEDYETTEDVFAAYLMGTFEFNGWQVIAGARVEQTDFKTEGYQYSIEEVGDDEIETVEAVSFGKDYTNFLPGLHVRKAFGDSLVVRASWTNTFARPTFEQSRPGIEDDGGEIERGNPDLDPYEAMNFDLSVQYDSEAIGSLGAAIFFKDIESFIYEQTFDEGDNEITTFENGESGDLLGVELSYYRNLGFLPGPLSGLNISANLTAIDSSADAQRPGGGDVEEVPFLKQSDLIGNVSLAWEYGRYTIRLSATYRDEYLDELGEDASQDRYVDDFVQLDLYSSVQLYEGFRVFAEVNNLTNEPFRAFWGESFRLSQFEEYGVSGAVGAKWSF